MGPRRSRQFIVVIFVPLAVAAGFIAWRVVGSRPSVSVGSAYPMSYVVVYQLTENDTALWEVVSVQRPLIGSDLMYKTAGPPGRDATPISGTISSATALYAVSARDVQLVTGRQPGPPSGDEGLGIEIDELVRRGLANDQGSTKTVAGRRCAVYRFLKPPTGPIPPYSGEADHDDLCIDADGLVLAETWVTSGRVALRRTAVEVHTSEQAPVASSAPAAPSIDSAKPPSIFAATLTPDLNPSTFIAAPPVPDSFEAKGPALDFRLPDPSAPTQTVARTTLWTFTSGARVITAEAGRERGGLPWSESDTVTGNITLAGLGRATTAARSDGFELRIDLGGGLWVRVHGTVPLARLIAYGHQLTHAAAPTGG